MELRSASWPCCIVGWVPEIHQTASIGCTANARSAESLRLLYDQIGNFDLFTSSHSWQAFMLLQSLGSKSLQ